ncbi:microcystin LR degradation protein MlrC [candidate division KSB3 bacterium]|uniref:Microcystin LR degradation protein MlrC n=1 Tax=candidate division KSB3 bacterium TaxID=2044937 RepID=A0A2G6E1Q2_9BACT|nr:MAG: microcystin LR degradation protein MlrC [candidate division KSB3 bacterium]PIE28581.1 MAG: microcystin LR degradation protein MlrC [candidate division KSB3 bacterium]
MNILVAGFHHESNTFSPIITTEDDFVVLRGDEIFSQQQHYGSINGVISTLQSFEGYHVHPTLFARAVPNGVVSKEFYLKIRRELWEMIQTQDGIDAITLALHGSMRVEEIGDAEGDILELLRCKFPTIPIVAALDMHATITDTMMANATAFVGYKCAPHTDTYETGAQAAELTHFTLKTGIPLTMSTQRIPMLIAGEKSETSVPPMDARIARLRELEQEPNVLAASYFLGFPWADTEDNGVFPLVVTAGDRKNADDLVRQLAEEFWAVRRHFRFHTETYAVDDALRAMFASTAYPTFLSDSGDNPTAGAAGDSTDLLRAVLNSPERTAQHSRILYAGFYDPDSVEACLEKTGAEVDILLGGRFETRGGKPLPLKVTVQNVVRNWGVYQADLVHAACDTLDIILTSKHIGFVDPSVMRILGLEPEERKFVIVKLGYLTDPFKRIAARSILALSLGASHEVLEHLEYQRLRRPVFPLDPNVEFRSEKT